MGSPKHLIEWRGETWLERIAKEVDQVAEEVFLAGGGAVPASLENRTRLTDAPGPPGPLAGLLAAFAERPDTAWLAVACDQPLLTASALRWLVSERLPGVDAILPRLDQGCVEPFPGIYEPGSARALRVLAQEASRRRSLQRLPDLVRVASPLIPANLREQFRGANSPRELAELG